MGAPMPTRMSGVRTKITTAAAVLDRSEAYQGLAFLEVRLRVGDRGLAGADCAVIVHLIGFETDDGVARTTRGCSAADHPRVVRFDTPPLDVSAVVEVRGFEPLASSVRVRARSPLCGSGFAQVAADRQGLGPSLTVLGVRRRPGSAGPLVAA